MQKYKLIIFDLDGTLLDTLTDLKNAVNYALISQGFPKRTLEEVREFVGNGTKVLMKRALPSNVDEETYAEAYNDFINYYLSHDKVFTKPYDEIIELLKTLKEKGYHTAVISNKNDVAAKALVNLYFNDLIDITIGTRDFNKTKPNPESTLEAMHHFNYTNNECVFVGDSDVDIATATNAGLPCISVSWGFRSKIFLKSHQAQIIIDSPKELLKHI